jgi:carboxyvinyl-carboxyphosphonate phosphorylmutase
MNWTERRERLRAIIARARIHPASVYDADFRAHRRRSVRGDDVRRLVARSACWLRPISACSRSPNSPQAYRINRAGSLPLLVDADHGYGNALSVKRTVEELETAGVSALTIEDTLLPVPFGGDDAQLIPIAEGVGKMRAALAGRQDPRLVVVGRTSAMGITGVDDTIARLKAYEAAGVDMLFMAGVTTRAQLDAVAQAVKLPLFLGGVPQALMDLDYLTVRNVRVCLQGHQSFWASVQGVHDTLKALREGTKPGELKNIAGADLQKRVLRQADYAKWTKEFLGG